MVEIEKDIGEQQQSKYQDDKESLQVYLFLVHWMFEVMQQQIKLKKSNQWESMGKQSSRSRALNLIFTLLNLNLNVLFVCKSDLDFCISE